VSAEVTEPTPNPTHSVHRAPGPSPSPVSAEVVVPLVGRPNSGKSSLYNRLTGGDAKVGNFPGVTVDILEAHVPLRDGTRARIVDLPGLYSIEAVVDPKTDEGVARGFIESTLSARHPLVVVQVIDATQLTLGLRLTRELSTRPFSLLVVVTQRDVLAGEGRSLDAPALAHGIGSPVVAVSARDPASRDIVLDAVAALLRDAPKKAASTPDWDPKEVATKAVRETDKLSPQERRRRTFTARADAWLLHPLFGPALFLGLMALVFAAVFLVADPVTDFLDTLVGLARAALTHRLGEGLFTSFLGGGLIAGAGTVLAFMPQIVILTVAMEVLDATGYLARGAFLLDRLLRLLGLSGRSFLPLLLGHACAVPAITSTRVVRDPRERLTTILVLPLMTCAGRIPTYALLLGTFFAAYGAWVRAGLFVGLYFAGILSGLVASLVLRRSATKGKTLPLVLEMPSYRMPQAKVVLRKAWQSATRFLRDVGSVILVAAAILWALLTIPMPGHANDQAAPIEHSIAASVGRAVEPVTRPLGFDWRINVGLIGSFGARELMVGTMGVIFGVEDAGHDPAPLTDHIRRAKKPSGAPLYTRATALALLAFFMLACQCMSTLSAVYRETKSLVWPALLLGYTYAAAYVVALGVYQLSSLIGLGAS
jgi:ferrous iron transport protein B